MSLKKSIKRIKKRVDNALQKFTPEGIAHKYGRKAFRHVRHKVLHLDSKHITGKLFGGNAGVGSYDSGTNWSPRTISQLTGGN